MNDPRWPSFYFLPSSPIITCQDRFGMLDSDDIDVPFWSVLDALLSRHIASVSEFIGTLEFIAVELRGSSLPDYQTLKTCLQARDNQFVAFWPAIARLALAMPRLFPERRLPILQSRGTTRLDLTREQVACLVVHQFLGTMAAPVWQDGFQNFDIWYQGEQPHAKAPSIYITAVLNYFERIATCPSLLDHGGWLVSYELVAFSKCAGANGITVDGIDLSSDSRLSGIILEPMSSRTAEADFLGIDGNAVVISANKFIGFGRTATQEEAYVGCSPEACPAVLITPPLGDDHVLAVRGCEAMVKAVGQGRLIDLVGSHDDSTQTSHQHESKWRTRTMLFMDALELDSFDGIQYPDIDHTSVDREILKIRSLSVSLFSNRLLID